MSSESDPDEFYDASDVTPNRQSTSFLSRPEEGVTTEISQDNSQPQPPPPPLPLTNLVISQDVLYKADRPSSLVTMGPPPAPPQPFLHPLKALNKSEGVTVCDGVTEDSVSACSGSLLGNLADDDDDDEAAPRVCRGVGRRRGRHPDTWRNIQGDDDDSACPPSHPSPLGSQSSSVDGIYPAGRTSHPFRVVEVDSASVQSSVSLGKVGKILAGMEGCQIIMESQMGSVTQTGDHKRLEPSITPPKSPDTTVSEVAALTISPEPDLVASTKSTSSSDKSNSLPRTDLENSGSHTSTKTGNGLDPTRNELGINTIMGANLGTTKQPDMALDVSSGSAPPTTTNPTGHPPSIPVAPPRKKRRNRHSTGDDSASVSSLPAPSLTLASGDSISIGHSLDLRQAVRGEYLVKPQDSENAKALGPTADELGRLETDESTSQASTPEASRTPSRIANMSHPPPSTSDPPTPSTPASIPSSTPPSDSPKSFELKEVSTKQLNLMVRTRSDSGKELTDAEILQQVTVLNLDTGERIALSDAENCLPKALNPLSLHIMRLTSEYVSSSSTVGVAESDEESVVEVNVKKLPDVDSSAVKKKTSQLKKFLGRKMESAVNKAKSLAQEVSSRHREEKDVFEDDTPAHDTMHYVKIKTTHNHKGPHEFDNLMYVQEIQGEHTGPIWCSKFSICGRLLATAGQDHMLRVWVLKQSFNYFLDIRTKCNADIKVSPTPSQESLVSQHSGQSGEEMGSLDPNDDGSAPFMPKPFCVYTGHSADMLDISWSKNYFILTSSMDKTVRLWHISRKECLCIFQHMDFVTAIAFHPKDDRYFISGALDGKLRLWSIPDKRVVLWNEVEGQPNLITAANFCQNGKYTVLGTYDGRCMFYETDQLKYYTQIYVRSSRGKNARGQKITGIEPLPGEDKILITSNDSRIRLYDLRDLNLSCKYKGYSNMSSQIRASFSHDGKFIVAGSENQCIYIWKTNHDCSKFSSARRDRNEFWEGVKAHNAVVTCAVFAPHPELVFSFIEQQQEALNRATQQQQQINNKDSGSNNKGYVLVSADFNGCIKVFLKKEKPKHSSLPASALA